MATIPTILNDIAWEDLSQAEQIAQMTDEERATFLSEFTEQELEALEHDWQFWGRPDQHPPADEQWDVWFLLGGRGSGKSRSGAEWINSLAESPCQHFAIIGENAAEVRDVMVEGASGILATAKPWNPAVYEPSKRRIIWPKTQCWATTFSGDTPDQLRGPNVHAAWVDEWAKFRYPDLTWDNLEMVLRAGEHPRVCVSTTPKPFKKLKEILSDTWTRVVRWSTYRNIGNLAKSFIRRILRRYEGTRLGRQELHAELLEDNPDALWSHDLLDSTRVTSAPELVAIAIGIDPPGGLITECGIVASGRSADEQGYTLADRSVSGKPETWAAATWQLVLALADQHDVDRPVLIAEKNHGGEMVRATLEVARPKGCYFPIELVTASKGKAARAEPVVMLYEQNRYHHVGTFGALEDELTQWNPLDPTMPSPNRLDALVWSAHGLKLPGVERIKAGTWGR